MAEPTKRIYGRVTHDNDMGPVVHADVSLSPARTREEE